MRRLKALALILALVLVSGCEAREAGDGGLYCTLSIDCAAILDNMESLNEDKADIIPEDGIIYAERTVEFSEGDSAFDVLKREAIAEGIHMEFVQTPGTGSMYIEGIANIYEFDCGELSGWTYKVNGEAPQTSASDYILEDGDCLEWRYTCDLGKDV